MTRLVVARKWLGLALLLVILLRMTAISVQAQRLAGADERARGNLLQQAGQPLPQGPLKGAWGEVIMANDKWVVVQNQDGQQFPIANEAVDQFLVRWPSSLAAIGHDSVVEAIGLDVGSNVVRTDHVDVFEGPDRDLVAYPYMNILANNVVDVGYDPPYAMFMNWIDFSTLNFNDQNMLYGFGYLGPPQPASIPAFFHAVGRAMASAPLRLLLPGNNLATVLPDSPAPLTVFQVTRGDSTFAEKGDLVYMLPLAMTTRTVRLSQAVLYKKVPLREFRVR